MKNLTSFVSVAFTLFSCSENVLPVQQHSMQQTYLVCVTHVQRTSPTLDLSVEITTDEGFRECRGDDRTIVVTFEQPRPSPKWDR